MPRIIDPETGGTVGLLVEACAALYDQSSTYTQYMVHGALSAGPGAVYNIGSTNLDSVTFALGTAPSGSGLHLDVLTSSDGLAFASATQGAGLIIPAGSTSGSLTSFVGGATLQGTCSIRVDVLAAGGAADLTIGITGGPF